MIYNKLPRGKSHKMNVPDIFWYDGDVQLELVIKQSRAMCWCIMDDDSALACAVVYMMRIRKLYNVNRKQICELFFFATVLAIKNLHDYSMLFSLHFEPFSASDETVASFNQKVYLVFRLLKFNANVRQGEVSLQNTTEEIIKEITRVVF